MWLTGHSFIKAKVKEIKAPFGGELSGHIFFMDNFFVMMMLPMLVYDFYNTSNEPLSHYLKRLINYPNISPVLKLNLV